MTNNENGYSNGSPGVPVIGARARISQYFSDREPPCSLEAEVGTLASILLDEEGAITDRIMEIVSSERFFRDVHQTIFRAMTQMHGKGIPIDATTLADELGPASLKLVGGDEYIGQMIRKVPHPANGAYYAAIVEEKAKARELIEVANEIIKEGYSQQFTADELLKQAVQRIDAIQPNDICSVDMPLSMHLEMGEAAFRGLAGRIVESILPETEACREAILLQFLTAIGNLFGPSPHFFVGATKHRCNLFACIVAPTGCAKGMSWDATEWSLRAVNPEWTAKPFLQGMTSGEGVIMEAKELSGPVLAVETEFARTMVNMNRDGNSLNAILRQGWESQRMRIPTKNNPVIVENAHLSVIAHVPPGELKGKLSPGDIENGLVNRFLWVHAYLSKLLPRGGSIDNMQTSLDPYVKALSDTVLFGSGLKHAFQRTDKAEAFWEPHYGTLRLRPPGPHGSATARAAALTMRLALIYALLDRKPEIGVSHLESALAVWDYCDGTAKAIFGDGKHDAKMDKLLAALEACPDGLTRTQIARHVFRSHIAKEDLDRLLNLARSNGNLVYTEESPNGTKAQSWMHRKYVESAHRAHLRTGRHNI